MRKILIYLLCGFAILFFVIASGCVAPPKEIPGTTSNTGNANTGETQTTTTGTPSYLTQATLFPTQTVVYGTVQTTAPVAKEAVCLIGLTYINATFNL